MVNLDITFTQYLIFITSSFGIKFLIFDDLNISNLTNRFLEFIKAPAYVRNKLMVCSYCQGFWVGLIVSLIIFHSVECILLAFSSAIFSYTYFLIFAVRGKDNIRKYLP